MAEREREEEVWSRDKEERGRAERVRELSVCVREGKLRERQREKGAIRV